MIKKEESQETWKTMEDEESKNKANRATRLRMGCEGRVQNKLRKRGEARLSRMLKAGGNV